MTGGKIPSRKVARDALSQEIAREWLRYDAATGILTWLKTPCFGISPGQATGYVTRKGYLSVRLCGEGYQAHRLAWFITFGVWPSQIDHINGNRADNRLCNLREVTDTQNQLNRSGRRGTAYLKRDQKYGARTTVNGTRIFLGLFDTEEEAHQAYLRAHAKYHGEYSFTQRAVAGKSEGDSL